MLPEQNKFSFIFLSVIPEFAKQRANKAQGPKTAWREQEVT